MTLRPPGVALRARKPILRARFLRCGRNVGCIVYEKRGPKSVHAGGGVKREVSGKKATPQAWARYDWPPRFNCEQSAGKKFLRLGVRVATVPHGIMQDHFSGRPSLIKGSQLPETAA